MEGRWFEVEVEVEVDSASEESACVVSDEVSGLAWVRQARIRRAWVRQDRVYFC